MAAELPPVLKHHYDRVAAVIVLILLLGSLLYLIMNGVQRRKDASAWSDDVRQSEPSEQTIKPTDLSAPQAKVTAAAGVLPQLQLAVLPVDEANLCTPERRVLCVKCTKPIFWKAEKCAFCSTVQPKEKKIDLSQVDTDGDGLKDFEEKAYGLDPGDASDALADNDGDGFSNIEEHLAGTDMNDAKSHPGYRQYLAVTDFRSERLAFRAYEKTFRGYAKDDKGATIKDANGQPVRLHYVTFAKVDNGVLSTTQKVRVKEGEAIGNTGFRFVRYTDKEGVRTLGANNQEYKVNISTIEIERISDGKKVTMTFYDTTFYTDDARKATWPGEPLVEQRAVITAVKDDVELMKALEVAPGKTFAVRDEIYTVEEIDAEKKTVKLKENATKSVFRLK